MWHFSGHMTWSIKRENLVKTEYLQVSQKNPFWAVKRSFYCSISQMSSMEMTWCILTLGWNLYLLDFLGLFLKTFYEPADSLKPRLKFQVESWKRFIALSHDMYKYIMNKVLEWGIKEHIVNKLACLVQCRCFFLLFLFIKIKIVDTNKHNVPVFSTIVELDCYKKKRKDY